MFFCDDSLGMRFHLFRHLAFWELTVCQFEDLASHILQAASIQRVAPLFLLCHNLTCVGRKNTDFSLQYLFHLLWGEYIVLFGIWLQQISTSFITRNRAKPISFQVWTQQLGPPTSTYNMHPCGMLPCRWLASLVASWKPKTGCQHPFSSWLSAHESYMKIHEVTVPWGMPSSGWHPCTETAASRLFGAFRSHSITDEWLWWDVYLS